MDENLKRINFDLKKRLSKLIQFKTISYEHEPKSNFSEIEDLYKWIELTYPEVWAKMERTVIGNNSMIFKWLGSSKNILKPILLMAHIDVVPPGSKKWDYEPFGGMITENFIWGRGSLDDKQNVLGILESVDYLLMNQFKPSRDIYFSFGFDEEIGGHKSAKQVAQYFLKKHIFFEFVHDEGLPVVKGIMPGIFEPIATVAVAEKGHLELNLKLKAGDGHSSMPPPSTAIGRMAKVITNIESNPLAKEINGPVRIMLETIAPHMSLYLRPFMSNLWLFNPVIKYILSSNKATNALMSTTASVNMINGGTKLNVIPSEVTVMIDCRVSPLHSIKKVLEHYTKIILDTDSDVQITVIDYLEPSPISNHESSTFQTYSKVIRTVFENKVLVSPSLMIANTDTRHYTNLTKNIYRFSANILDQKEIDSIHGLNERISKENILNVINFFYQLIKQFN